ncbi:putative GPI-anchored protein, partial [Cucurbita argyrosperma subsp. argyrosperma]
MPPFTFLFISFVLLCLNFHFTSAGFLVEPVSGQSQPLNPGEYSSPNTVPAFPVQTQMQICHLDLSDELFGGVREACGRNLDRSRCCPVLAAWLFAAHARAALKITASTSTPEAAGDLPMMPDDSQKCVNSLQTSLLSRNIKIPQPNASCDAVLCFCGIRLHQISSLSCPAAFNVSGGGGSGYHNATPTVAVRNLEKSCRNSSYSGCTKCLGALQKVTGTKKNASNDRASKMFNRDCQLMGLTWLLARNKTTYIPTVSAVLRAIMYSAHPPHQSTCSPDQENMPLAVDSLQMEKAQSSSPPSISLIPIIPLLISVYWLAW